MRILVVEDQEIFARQVIDVVESLGGECAWVTTLENAGEEIREAQPPYQAVVLDRILHDGNDDTLHFIGELRREGYDLPVIIASALTGHEHHLNGLEAGAVDYVAKPYEARELEVRLRLHTDRTRFNRGPLEIDIGSSEAFWNGEPLQLSLIPFRILRLLAQNAGEPVHRNALHRAAWPGKTVVSRAAVDTAIKRVRDALDYFDQKDVIELIDKYGYRLNLERVEKP